VKRRQLVWRGLEEWLAEECTVSLEEDRFRARGVQLGAEPHPYRVDYELVTGVDFVTERLVASAGSRTLELLRSADGAWTANAEPLPDLDGALDCDLAFSPLTNYMPARRLGAEPVDHLMAFVDVPSLEVRPSRQRYEPIDERRVRYVSLDGDFVSELELDEDGLVVRYPRLAELVPSGARA
jgi:uncharacterized protein